MCFVKKKLLLGKSYFSEWNSILVQSKNVIAFSEPEHVKIQKAHIKTKFIVKSMIKKRDLENYQNAQFYLRNYNFKIENSISCKKKLKRIVDRIRNILFF